MTGWLRARRSKHDERFDVALAPAVVDVDAARDLDVDLAIVDDGLKSSSNRNSPTE